MAKSHLKSFCKVYLMHIIGIAALYGSDDEKKLKFAFDIYDIDRDGFISNG